MKIMLIQPVITQVSVTTLTVSTRAVSRHIAAMNQPSRRPVRMRASHGMNASVSRYAPTYQSSSICLISRYRSCLELPMVMRSKVVTSATKTRK